MSRDLLSQLADYGAFHEEQQSRLAEPGAALAPASMIEMGPDRTGHEPESPTSGRAYRRVFATVAAAVLVSALVWISIGDSDDPATVTTLNRTPATLPSSTAAASPQPETGNDMSAPVVGLDTSVGRLVWAPLEGTRSFPRIIVDIDGSYIASRIGDDHMLFSADGATWTTTPTSADLAGYVMFDRLGEDDAGTPWARAAKTTWPGRGDVVDLFRHDGSVWVRIDWRLSEDLNPQDTEPVRSGELQLISDPNNKREYWLSNRDGPLEHHIAPWQWPVGVPVPEKSATFVPRPGGGFTVLVSAGGVYPGLRDLPPTEAGPMVLHLVQIWTSPDGATWEKMQTPDFLLESINEPGSVVATTDQRALLVKLQDGNGIIIDAYKLIDDTWLHIPFPSTTGSAWATTESANFLYRSDVALEAPVVDAELQISVDGQSWEDIKPPPEPGDFVATGTAGDVIWISANYPGDTLWVGRFEN